MMRAIRLLISVYILPVTAMAQTFEIWRVAAKTASGK